MDRGGGVDDRAGRMSDDRRNEGQLVCDVIGLEPGQLTECLS